MRFRARTALRGRRIKRACLAAEWCRRADSASSVTTTLALAFDHDPDHGLGAGRAQQTLALVPELARVACSAAPDLGVGLRNRTAFLRFHVDQHLRIQPHAGASWSRPLALGVSACSTCSAETMPSPVVCLSRQMMWPEFSPPSCQPLLVAASPARSGRRPLRARTECRVRRAPAPCRSWSSACRPRRRSAAVAVLRKLRNHEQQLVAVVDVAACVDHDQAVAVAVQCHAEVGADAPSPPAPALCGWVAPHSRLMLRPSGCVADRDHIGTELVKHVRRDVVAGAVSAIHHDLRVRAGRDRWGRCSCRTRCSVRRHRSGGAPCRAAPRARSRSDHPAAPRSPARPRRAACRRSRRRT